MQTGFPVQVLPLKPQVLLFDVRRFSGFLGGITPSVITGLPYTVPIVVRQFVRQSVRVVVVVPDSLQWAQAINTCQRFIAPIFIKIKAGLVITMLLYQLQPVPDKTSGTKRITVAVLFGFCNPTT